MDGLMMRRHALLASNGLGKVDLTLTADTAPQSVTASKKSKVRSCEVSFSPKQDLHGQTGPYPAGGGANQWDEEWEVGLIDAGNGNNTTSNSYSRSKNFTPLENGKSYYFCPISKVLYLRLYDENKTYLGYKQIAQNGDHIFTVGETYYTVVTQGDVAYVRFCWDGTTYNNDIAINYPSSVTTYSPYSNVCPIYGSQGGAVRVTGKNMFQLVPRTVELNGVEFTPNSDGTVTANGTATNTVMFALTDNSGTGYHPLADIGILPGVSYILNGCPEGGGTNSYYLMFSVYGSGKEPKDYGSGVTFTFDEADFEKNYRIIIFIKSGVTVNNLTFKPMIRLSTVSDAEYEPYRSDTVSVTFPASVGTVYGGTFDPVTGQGVVTSGIVTYNGTENWNLNSNGVFARNLDGSMKGNAKPGHCNILPVQTAFNATSKGVLLGGSATDGYVYVCGFQNEITSVADFKTFLSQNNMIIVYPLATPIPFTVPPQSMQNLPKGVSYAWATMERDVT